MSWKYSCNTVGLLNWGCQTLRQPSNLWKQGFIGITVWSTWNIHEGSPVILGSFVTLMAGMVVSLFWGVGVEEEAGAGNSCLRSKHDLTLSKHCSASFTIFSTSTDSISPSSGRRRTLKSCDFGNYITKTRASQEETKTQSIMSKKSAKPISRQCDNLIKS